MNLSTDLEWNWTCHLLAICVPYQSLLPHLSSPLLASTWHYRNRRHTQREWIPLTLVFTVCLLVRARLDEVDEPSGRDGGGVVQWCWGLTSWYLYQAEQPAFNSIGLLTTLCDSTIQILCHDVGCQMFWVCRHHCTAGWDALDALFSFAYERMLLMTALWWLCHWRHLDIHVNYVAEE